MSIALANVSVVVNNEPVAIVPNSFKYTEGKGEQTMRAASSGGGAVEQVFSENVEMNFSMVSFGLFNDIDSIETARSWKSSKNNNVVSFSGATSDGKTIERTFTQSAILNDYEVELGADTNFEIEFKSNPAV